MTTRRGFLKSLVALAASRAVPIPRGELRAAASLGLTIPVGTIFYALDAHGATVHMMKTDRGFVELVGGVLSRKHYPALFDVIGTTWGKGHGDGETFTLPDLRQITPAFGQTLSREERPEPPHSLTPRDLPDVFDNEVDA